VAKGKTLLIESGKIYLRAYRTIFEYPLFWRLSIGYFFIFEFAIRALLVLANRNFPNFSFLWEILELSRVVISLCFPMIYILMVFQLENELNKKEIFRKFRLNLWNYFWQSLVGLLIAFAFTLPLFCLLMFSVYVDGMSLIAPFWYLSIDFLILGSVSLATRILLDQSGGYFQNSMAGLRMLNYNLRFFMSFYLIGMLIWVVILASRAAIGSFITGVDIFSVPFFPLSDFYNNFADAIDVPLMTFIYAFINTMILLLTTIAQTLAYLRCRDLLSPHETLAPTQPLTTEN
jgi:hypothetical protein